MMQYILLKTGIAEIREVTDGYVRVLHGRLDVCNGLAAPYRENHARIRLHLHFFCILILVPILFCFCIVFPDAKDRMGYIHSTIMLDNRIC